MSSVEIALPRLIALLDRLRPVSIQDVAEAETHLREEITRLRGMPEEAAELGEALQFLLSLPYQNAFYAETGVRSALGFGLELAQRLSQRFLPQPPDDTKLADLALQVFRDPDDYLWVGAVSDALWVELAGCLQLAAADEQRVGAATRNVLEGARMLSYRLAGAALDRELLRAESALERYESPFLAQNAALVPILERARSGGAAPSPDEIREIDVLLDQCTVTLERVRRKAGEGGVSVRLTYLLARLRQLIARLRDLLDLELREDHHEHGVRLLKVILTGLQTRTHLSAFLGENVSLLARNVTDHASRHGEHYIADSRSAWWGMARSAAGGGVIIAIIAMIKIKLTFLHLPPLTEGIVFGINYGIGFVLIHLLGFTVATKQPAMTAAAIAATLEDARPRELESLGIYAQNVLRTQWIAVLGNVGLALPVACLLTMLWAHLTQSPIMPDAKLDRLLLDIHPLQSGALFFAAVAGLGLFLSGLVSGYFDNQARYLQLGTRIGAQPSVQWLGKERAVAFGSYIDTHYGAILGNLFFGMYLGLGGVVGGLTGLPVDIRHVAFASANLGTALTLQPWPAIATVVPWAIAGVMGIAFINLAVSFALALYVAMKSRRLGASQIFQLGGLLMKRFRQNPARFFWPPR